MKYTIYKITNNLNNKIYIGCHKTKNPMDDYMGSGVAIKRAVEKYGVENFTKEILEVFDNETDMHRKEKEIVSETFINRPDTYNMTIGGRGSFSHIDSSGESNPNYGNHEPLSEEHRKKIGDGVRGEKNGMFGRTHTKEAIAKIIEANIGKVVTQETKDLLSQQRKGVPKTEEHKKAMSEAAKRRWKNNPILTCPHCAKEGRGSAMKQWHFDNCKFK